MASSGSDHLCTLAASVVGEVFGLLLYATYNQSKVTAILSRWRRDLSGIGGNRPVYFLTVVAADGRSLNSNVRRTTSMLQNGRLQQGRRPPLEAAIQP